MTTNCGNNVAEAGEQCDGTDLNGGTCAALGFDGGTLKCKAGCTFDTSSCTTAVCGNNRAEAGEECDGTDLNGAHCTDFGFSGGILKCGAGTCNFDVSTCTP
jgi:hypothetical protein